MCRNDKRDPPPFLCNVVIKRTKCPHGDGQDKSLHALRRRNGFQSTSNWHAIFLPTHERHCRDIDTR